MDRIIPKTEEEYAVFLQTLAAAITVEGTRDMTAMEAASIDAIGKYVLDYDVDARSLPLHYNDRLEQVIHDPALRQFLIRMLMSLIPANRVIEDDQVAELLKLAKRLDAEAEELALITLAHAGKWRKILWRIVKHAAIEYWNTDGKISVKDILTMIQQAMFPGFFTNAKIAAKYNALADKAPGSLGYELYHYYKGNGFEMPGEKGGLDEKFVLHECYHLLTGYGNSGSEEMLVSGFTGGNKEYQPMDWVIAPILQWHMGAPVASQKEQYTNKNLLDPPAYYNAVRRGMDMSINLMNNWDWFDHIDTPLEQLRADYNIAPLDPELNGKRDPKSVVQQRAEPVPPQVVRDATEPMPQGA